MPTPSIAPVLITIYLCIGTRSPTPKIVDLDLDVDLASAIAMLMRAPGLA